MSVRSSVDWGALRAYRCSDCGEGCIESVGETCADRRLCRDCNRWSDLNPVLSPSRVPSGTSMTERQESPSRKGGRRSAPSENTAFLAAARDSGKRDGPDGAEAAAEAFDAAVASMTGADR